MVTRPAALVVVFSAFVLAACSESTTEPPDDTIDLPGDTITAPTAGMTAVYLTDGPFPYDRVERVDLYVVSISASLTADTGGVGGDTTGSNFTMVAEPNRRYNIFELQNGTTAALGDGELPAGLYRAVRMVLDTDSSSSGKASAGCCPLETVDP